MTYVKILLFWLISFAAVAQTVDQYKTTTAAGSVNAYTIPNSDFGAYRTNEKWLVDFTGVTTNSGAATLNRNSYGAKSIKMPDGTNPTAGILTGRVQLSYNGTYFYIVGGAGGSGGGTVAHANNGNILSGDTVQWGGPLTKNTFIEGYKKLDFGDNLPLNQFQVTTGRNDFSTQSFLTIYSDSTSGTTNNYFELSSYYGNKHAGILAHVSSSADQLEIQQQGNGFINLSTGLSGGSLIERFSADSIGNIKIMPNGTTGSNGQFLKTDGTGKVSWATVSSGSSTFVGLTDGPGSFSGKALNFTRVNSGATALEYQTPSQVLADIGGQASGNYITALTGDVTATGPGSSGATLATVNSNVGTFGSATKSTTVTANGKGLITAISEQTITPAWSSITGTPTTLAGYGITSPLPVAQGGTAVSSAGITAFNNITGYTASGATGTTSTNLVFSASPAFTGTPTYGTLGYSDTDIAFSFQKSVNSYFQIPIQNTNSGATASTDLIISSDNGTATTHYLDLGKNSSGFTGSGSLNAAGYSYLTSTSDDLVIGTTTANGLHFLVNSGTTDAFSISSTGLFTFTAPIVGNSIGGTATATANNQNFLSVNPTLTSRSTSGDNFSGLNVGGSIAAASTLINASPVSISTSLKSNGGISTGVSTGLQQGANTSPYVSKTVAGMTVTTYNNVAPASTSGPGTGALFQIIVATSSSFTSFNCTTSGSGYSVGETVTFNGSQFGGSGSITLAIISTTNTFGTNAASLIIKSPYADYSGIANPLITAVSVDGTTFLGGISISYSGNNGTNTPSFIISDPIGSLISSNGTTASLGQRTWSFNQSTLTSISSITVSGGMTGTTLTQSSTYTNTGAYTASLITSGAAMTSSGNAHINGTSVTKSVLSATGGVNTGIPSTYTVNAAGSGYTAGSKGTGAGSISGATGVQVTITVSGGGIATAVPAGSASGAGGFNYVVNDILTVTGGTGGSIKVTAIDQFGGIAAFTSDLRSTTDASSNNSYISFNSAPTYILTGSSSSTWFAYYNPTYTSFGTGTKGGIAIVPTGTLSTIGGSTYDATLKLIGSGSNAVFKTVGAGTGTNKSLDAYQSDGTTNILFLKDNGDFQVGLSSSKWGMFGTSAVAQQSVLGILVNNVTSGGTTSTIADFTDLSTYSTDAPTIRNDIYQLAKKQLAIETALRNYGILKD